jgi:RNA binding exosome subunit
MKEIRAIEIEAFIHATEDREKVLETIHNLIPPEIREENFILNKVRGVFHNPIIIVKARYSENVNEIIKFIAQNLNTADKKYLSQSLSRRIDNGNLYFRVGKQALFQKKIEIQDEKDTIKVRVSFSNRFSKPEKMKELLQELDLIKS